jgi:hypothetical protein
MYHISIRIGPCKRENIRENTGDHCSEETVPGEDGSCIGRI